MTMKKILLAITILSVAGLSGCSKTCHCKASVGENSVEITQTLRDGEKCSDYNTAVNIAGISAKYKCTPQLF